MHIQIPEHLSLELWVFFASLEKFEKYSKTQGKQQLAWIIVL